MLLAYDCGKGYSIDLLGAINLLSRSWKELAARKIANCFAHAGFSRARVLDEPADDTEICNNLYRTVHEIVGATPEDDFDSYALADADISVVAPSRTPRLWTSCVARMKTKIRRTRNPERYLRLERRGTSFGCFETKSSAAAVMTASCGA